MVSSSGSETPADPRDLVSSDDRPTVIQALQAELREELLADVRQMVAAIEVSLAKREREWPAPW